MLAAVDTLKSKILTIIYASLKYSLIGIILLTSLQNSSSSCQITQSYLYTIFIMFYKLSFVLDIVTLVYVYCSKDNNRMQYYVLLTIHFAIMILICIFLYAHQDWDFQENCQIFKFVKFLCLYLRVLFFVITFIVMSWNLYDGLKFVHFGTNLFWTIFWAISKERWYIGINAIAFYHLFGTIVSIISLAVIKILRKTSFTSNCWKIIVITNIPGLIFCYIISIFQGLNSKPGFQTLFLDCYKKFGIIELVSPILYLIFVNVEWGDPREYTVFKYEHFFQKKLENQNIFNQSIA